MPVGDDRQGNGRKGKSENLMKSFKPYHFLLFLLPSCVPSKVYILTNKLPPKRPPKSY